MKILPVWVSADMCVVIPKVDQLCFHHLDLVVSSSTILESIVLGDPVYQWLGLGGIDEILLFFD